LSAQKYDHELIARLREDGKTWREIRDEQYPEVRRHRTIAKLHQDWLKRGGAHNGSQDAFSPTSTPDERVRVHETSDGLQAAVYASETVRTVDDLLERAEIDANEYEVVDSKVATWPVAMKIDDEPTVVELWYVAVRLKKKIKPHEFIREMRIHVPSKTYTAAKSGFFTSVHWSDIHFPHEDERTLNILYQVLDIVQPGLVADHGDTLDCEQISKYPKDPWGRVGLADEIKMAARHFGVVESLISEDCQRVWLEGNHEVRLKKEVWKMCVDRVAGEILTLEQLGLKDRLEWGNLFGISERGWEIVPHPKHKLLWDRLLLIHGNKVRGDSALSARAEHKTYGKSGLSGHTHRRGSYHLTDHNGTQTWYEMGMMGKIRDDYVAHANWQQGFMVISWSDDRKEWGPEPVPIHDGVAYFRGMRLEG